MLPNRILRLLRIDFANRAENFSCASEGEFELQRTPGPERTPFVSSVALRSASFRVNRRDCAGY